MRASFAFSLLFIAATAVMAADSPTLEEVAGRIKGAKAAELRLTPIKGIYEYQRGAEVAYVTEDGKYAFAGDLYLLGSSSNLTEARRREVRRSMLDQVPEASMLSFAPDKFKYTINVFTDVDCQFCRKLHSQIATYNKLGIRVRYLSFPRSGPDSASWTIAEKVWCSKDRNAALTLAKLDRAPDGAVCADNPVAAHYSLARSLRVSGTPAIVTEYGDMLEGYMPPADLLAELQSEAQRVAAAASAPAANAR
jgi:thiol:disulfide interchange protein DsbC